MQCLLYNAVVLCNIHQKSFKQLIAGEGKIIIFLYFFEQLIGRMVILYLNPIDSSSSSLFSKIKRKDHVVNIELLIRDTLSAEYVALLAKFILNGSICLQ